MAEIILKMQIWIGIHRSGPILTVQFSHAYLYIGYLHRELTDRLEIS